MTETAWIATLAVLCVGLLVAMGSVATFAWQQWADLRREQVSREVERIRHKREVEVLRQAVEQTHGKSPARTLTINVPASTPERMARDVARAVLEGMER